MLKNICHRIDLLNEWVGKYSSWLVIPLTFIVTYDVVLRYIFNSPTIWAWDIAVQLLALIAILGGGYALLVRAHIGIDVIVEHTSPKKRAIIDLITYVFFLFSVGILLWKTTSAAWVSAQNREASFSFFAPPVYPLKIVMAVGVFLLFLQGIANFIRLLSKISSSKAGGKA